MMMGGHEMLIVLAAVLLFFGASWIPKWARAFGKTKKEIDNIIEGD
jgi:Sec-independent protein translocase protein TatA